MKRFGLTLLLLGSLSGCHQAQRPLDGLVADMEIPLEADTTATNDSAAADEAADISIPEQSPADDEKLTKYLMSDGVAWNVRETIDCETGGTVIVLGRKETQDHPYSQEYAVQWQYDDCGTDVYGAISGIAVYTKTTRPKSNGWFLDVTYYADLQYSDGLNGNCNAYSHVARQTDRWLMDEVTLGSTCPHPVRQWWAILGVE